MVYLITICARIIAAYLITTMSMMLVLKLISVMFVCLVALQMPEGLLMFGSTIADIIEQ